MKVYHYCLNKFDNLLCDAFEVDFVFDFSDILTDSVKLHLRGKSDFFDVELWIWFLSKKIKCQGRKNVKKIV